MKRENNIMLKEKINIYCDMDGVLADFNAEPDGIARFKTEKSFFYNLKPLEKNINALKKLLLRNDKYNIFILSASPNRRADGDKRKWLKKYLPLLEKKNIIIVRNGKSKVNYMKTPDGILLDDYSKNLKEWCMKKNNRALKIKADGDIFKLLIHA